MKRLLNLRRLVRDTKGQDLIEYALLAGFVAVAVGAAMPPFIVSISGVYSKLASVLSNSASTGS